MSEREIFIAALNQPDAAQRAAFLEQVCGADDALRARVEDLLREQEQLGSFLERPAGGPAATGPFPPALPEMCATGTGEGPGTAIGSYRLVRALGEGGMGTVWLAQQTVPVKRQVALKLIRPGMDSAQVIARFEAERQALALMDHPHIAKVFDAGATASGRPYFVMELVQGKPITDYCDEQRLTPKERLELMIPVCQAIQHAHQKGIIHRDIKPSNVLVTLCDNKPVPKVIDFGIAKATGQQLTEHTLATGLGMVVGTLEYMSPEQAEPNQLDIDTRSDVYSLGVLLYELLTGTTPLERKRLQKAALLEVLRVIREEEPPRPSTRLSTTDELPAIAARRGLEPKRLSGVVRGELDWIVMKALEKDRNRRYESANGFASDLQRFLADEPVQACPPSAIYRLRKLLRRNQGLVLAVVLVMLALIGGIIGTTIGLLQAQDEARKAGQERDQANQAREAEQKARNAESEQRKQAEERLVRLNVGRGLWLLDQGDSFGSLLWFAEALRLEQHDPAKAAVHRARLAVVLRDCPKLVQVWFHKSDAAIRLTPDGGRFLTIDGRIVSVWDAETGLRLSQFVVQDEKRLRASLSFNGRRVVTCCGEKDTAQVWDTDTGKPIALSVSVQPGDHFVFSPHGRCFFTAGRIWAAATGQPIGPSEQEARTSRRRFAAFSPDSRRVAIYERDRKTIRVWNADKAEPETEPIPIGEGPGVKFSPDNRLLAVYGSGGTARIWNISTGQPVGPVLPHQRYVWDVNFSPDGKMLATSGADGSARVWDAATGFPLTGPLLHRAAVAPVSFSPDSQRVLTASQDGTARLWDARTGLPVGPPLKHGLRLTGAAFRGDGNQVVTSSLDGTVRVWQTATPQKWSISKSLPPRLIHDFWPHISADGRYELRVQPGLKTVAIIDRATSQPVGSLVTPGGQTVRPAFSPDGRFIVTVHSGQARVWAAADSKPIAALPHGSVIYHMIISPDSRLIVTADSVGQTRVWNAATGKLVASLLRHVGGVTAMAFSADSRRLATAGQDGIARVWNAETGAPVTPPLRHGATIYSVSFRPDGARVVSACHDRSARQWDATTGQAIAQPLLHDGRVDQAAYSPDGSLIATIGLNTTSLFRVKVWDAATGELVAPAIPATFNRVGFALDGRSLIGAIKDSGGSPQGPPTVLQLDFGMDNRPAGDLTLLAEMLSGYRLDAAGLVLPLERERFLAAWTTLRAGYPNEFSMP
jgi:WD40 repeat protein/serine/threonine protein kinase